MLIRVSEPGTDTELMALLERAGEAVLSMEGLAKYDIEIDLTFASDEEIRALNREHRGKDSVTDVLSFPMFENKDDIHFAASHGMQKIIIGDVVVCLPVLARQALEYGHTEEREISYLFVHSLLHLLGYDHEGSAEDGTTGEAAMQQMTESVMVELDLTRS